MGEESQAASAAEPTLEAFVSLAREHDVIPVSIELVADSLTPVSVFASAVGSDEGFLLESVEGGERWGRYSFIGRRPLARIVAQRLAVSIDHESGLGSLLGAPTTAGILACVEHVIAGTSVAERPGLPPLHSGLVGYLGYDVVREVERLDSPPKDELGVPDAVLGVIGELVVFDHWRQRITLIVNAVPEAGADESALRALYEATIEKLASLAADCHRAHGLDARVAPSEASRTERAAATRRTSSEEFKRSVEAAKDLITAGDIFQVVLAQRFDIEGDVDPFSVYRSLRLLNPSPYLYFLRLGGVEVVGSSPEPMVRVRDRKVTSRPIAGTRRRGATEEEDRRLASELAEDPKELAEHVMLIDLARNDVGRVAEFGSEVVDELMTIERYSHVMHMTSQVVGTLRKDCSSVDVLRATLPAGTLSGAPKVRAMEIIDELEPARRGIYGGVVGYLDFSGNVDTAIAIRTMVVAPDGRASVQAGAGVVADSDPASEDEECMNKALAVLAAVRDSRRANLA